jgi:predicted RNA-binding Zn ribbon-like protein
MSKQQQAPGELELVREFVNTADLEQGIDLLSDRAGLGGWLAERGLAARDAKVSGADHARAIALREALRAILLAHNGRDAPSEQTSAVLDRTVERARLRLRFDERGVGRLEPTAGGVDGALGGLLAIIHRAGEGGTWERLKACPEHTCEWAFYDHTKNRSGTWCNMAVCGNRAKARAYRERRGEH